MINGSFLIVILLTIIGWCMYRFNLYKRSKSINILRECVLLLFIIYFLVLLSITVFKGFSIDFNNQFDSYMYKSKGIFGIINIVPFKDTIETLTSGKVPIKMPLRNIFGNILIFMPLGFIIPIIFNNYNKLSKIINLGFISSLSIEIVQLFVGYNICDIDDLIFNTTGAVLGFLCYKVFERMVSNTKLKSKLESISDYNTENIFKKSSRVVFAIGVLVIIAYIHGFYTQTASDKLSNEELAKKLFRNNDSEFIYSKDLGNKKFYLVKDEFGLGVQSLIKYSKSRYANTYEVYGYYPSDDIGYNVGVIHDYENEEKGPVTTIVVFGKNSNADKLVVSLLGKDYEFKLKNNDYFFEICPDYLNIDEDTITEIYNNEESKNFKVKFLDKKENEITSIKRIEIQE